MKLYFKSCRDCRAVGLELSMAVVLFLYQDSLTTDQIKMNQSMRLALVDVVPCGNLTGIPVSTQPIYRELREHGTKHRFLKGADLTH